MLVAGCAVIAGFGLLGALYGNGKVDHAWLTNLDGEYTAPALWSAALLAAAIGLAILLGYIALDELTSIHERLAVGKDAASWIGIYVPVLVTSGVVFAVILWRTWSMGLAPILLGGAVAWSVAVVLEEWEWSGTLKRSHYVAKMVSEEMLEMLGSLLLLVALVAVTQLAPARRRSSVGPV